MKLDQVQKFCSLTNHMWVGYWLLVNGAFWSGLAPEQQKLVADTFDAQALVQRTANQALDTSLENVLRTEGMEFVPVDTAPFRDVLAKSGFYKTWQDKFGAPLWSALESDSSPTSSNPVAAMPFWTISPTVVIDRSRTGRVIMPAWQNRQPRVHPRKISTL